MLKIVTKQYLKVFSEKNIPKLHSFFSKNITLRDWNVDIKGKKNILEENKKFFKSANLIKIKIYKIFENKNTIIVEFSIAVNKSKPTFIVDIIEFNKNNKIKSIRAYLGN